MHTAHTVTDIRAAAPYDARRMIGENMAAAILRAFGNGSGT